MAYSKDLLHPGEEIVLDLRPHWIYFARQVGLLLGLLVVAILALVLLPSGTIANVIFLILGVGVLGALAWFAIAYAKWGTTNFVLTTSRLIYREGVVAKSGTEIPLDRINTVFFSQSVLERMLGLGNLTIESAGEQGRQTFEEIRRPQYVQAEIYSQKEADEQRNIAAVGQAMQANAAGGVAPPPGADIPTQIAQLDQLRQQGVLSEAEFAAKKAELLGRM